MVQDFLGAGSPRASGFIVTLYGDVAAPRGGILWMGTLIESCAAQGISESLVRTAVSRLVENGRLAGERIGRKSYYRLTKAAEAEFSRAAEILYSPPPSPKRLLLALGARDLPDGWARIGPEAALAPEGMARPGDCAILATETLAGVESLPDLTRKLWPLEAVGAAYRDFIERFSPIHAALSTGAPPDGATALALRLRLVDHFRAAALADPRLPAQALPADWPANAARRLFVTLYLAVTTQADRHIGLALRNSDGLLPEQTTMTDFRVNALRREFST
ncbi:PaaX family transcriptional regulator [Martelella lutilitoris]|uniref:PaaX family transcriptional regulator n=1 Tax=Martelella lutilitoris TaxID=2583532 RepID=A0A7T7HJS1_9HYPH|nr:PaaX family transcriptional regulator C-terminal domain-containing protein [Martelella lutilitoris]QQM30474.1 PaaX family transcriptional regulator [Martelella lutilitoris]